VDCKVTSKMAVEKVG